MTGKIIQYTLSSGNASTIIGSRVDVFNSAVMSCASMKIAPDGKIYVAHDFNSSGGNYIGVINHPNLIGMACEYVDTSINLQGNLCSWGLNNLMEYGEYCANLYVKENKVPKRLLIYPNPAREEFYIDDDSIVGEIELIICDAKGAVIRRILTNNNNGQFTIGCKDLEKGLYFIQVAQYQELLASGQFILE